LEDRLISWKEAIITPEKLAPVMGVQAVRKMVDISGRRVVNDGWIA
jgi:hypothetical protein